VVYGRSLRYRTAVRWRLHDGRRLLLFHLRLVRPNVYERWWLSEGLTSWCWGARTTLSLYPVWRRHRPWCRRRHLCPLSVVPRRRRLIARVRPSMSVTLLHGCFRQLMQRLMTVAIVTVRRRWRMRRRGRPRRRFLHLDRLLVLALLVHLRWHAGTARVVVTRITLILEVWALYSSP
jgi:hypothetical protein